jgi:hypothetical protein
LESKALAGDATVARTDWQQLAGLPFVNDRAGPSATNDGDSTKAMARRHSPNAEERKRHTAATRLRRYARHLERYARAERVRSYDQQWLAYLKEHGMERPGLSHSSRHTR